MTKVTTFGQSPDTMTVAEMNNIQDDYEELFQEYKVIHYGVLKDLQSLPSPSISAFIMGNAHFQYGILPNSGLITATSVKASSFFWWDPLDYADLLSGAGGLRTLKMRLRTTVMCTGTTAPGVNFVFGIRQVTLIPGGTSVLQRNYSIQGASIAGFTTTHTAPGANTTNNQSVEMADASALAPALYAILWHANVTPNVSSDVNAFADLSVKVE